MRIVAERTVHYYITNLPVIVGTARVADLVRGHWGVENSLHWVLDDRRHLPGGPAMHRIELPDPSQTIFLAKVVNSPIAQDGGPQPRTTGAHHAWLCDDFVNTLGCLPVSLAPCLLH